MKDKRKTNFVLGVKGVILYLSQESSLFVSRGFTRKVLECFKMANPNLLKP